MKKTLLALGVTLIGAIAFAQNNTTVIEQAITKDNDKFVAIFKDLHQNPELGFHETRTAGIAAKELKSYGYTVTEHIGKTGIAAVMKNGNGPIVMYRADMDANAVKETTDLPYKSTKVVELADGSTTPVGHMCGHDAHVTWLLATAKFFAEHKNLWKGTVIFIGQPAEELIEGARAMTEDGLYTKYGIPEPDYLIGMHTAPIAVGMVIAGSGVRNAGTDQFDVTFYGIGGHGSTPNVTKDPVIMAATAIMQYQAIVSRAIDPKHAAVITVGSVQAGIDNNVIPASALLKVNLRWFNEKDRNTMIEGIKRINEGIAYAYNLDKDKYPTIKFKGWSYPLVNDEQLTNTVRKALKPVIKNEKFILDETLIPSSMGSEDFHHLVFDNKKKVAYCFINVGVAEPKRFVEAIKQGNVPFVNHNGNFEVDLSAIQFGSEVGITSLLAVFNRAK